VRRSGLETISARATPARCYPPANWVLPADDRAACNKLAGIFFNVQPLDADRLEVGGFFLFGHFHLRSSRFRRSADRTGDRVFLAVGIEITCASNLVVARHLADLRARAAFTALLGHLLIQQPQGAGQPRTTGSMCCWLVAEVGRRRVKSCCRYQLPRGFPGRSASQPSWSMPKPSLSGLRLVENES